MLLPSSNVKAADDQAQGEEDEEESQDQEQQKPVLNQIRAEVTYTRKPKKVTATKVLMSKNIESAAADG